MYIKFELNWPIFTISTALLLSAAKYVRDVMEVWLHVFVGEWVWMGVILGG